MKIFLYCVSVFVILGGAYAGFLYTSESSEQKNKDGNIINFFSQQFFFFNKDNEQKGKTPVSKIFTPCSSFTTFDENDSDKITATARVLEKTNQSDVLMEYACSSNILFRAHVAANKNSPTEVLEFLGNDQEWVVRNYLGANENFPSSLYEKFLTEEDPRVLLSFGRNPNISAETLMKLLERKEDAVQESLAINKGTTEELQMKLAKESLSTAALTTLLKREDVSAAVKDAITARNIAEVNAALGAETKTPSVQVETK